MSLEAAACGSIEPTEIFQSAALLWECTKVCTNGLCCNNTLCNSSNQSRFRLQIAFFVNNSDLLLVASETGNEYICANLCSPIALGSTDFGSNRHERPAILKVAGPPPRTVASVNTDDASDIAEL